MADAPEVLADLACVKVDGTAVVFVRPKHHLDHEEMSRLADSLQEVQRSLWIRLGLTFVAVPHEFDLMVVGDAELTQYGLTRLPTAADAVE